MPHTIWDDGMADRENSEKLAHNVGMLLIAPRAAQQALVIEVEGWGPPLLCDCCIHCHRNRLHTASPRLMP